MVGVAGDDRGGDSGMPGWTTLTVFMTIPYRLGRDPGDHAWGEEGRCRGAKEVSVAGLGALPSGSVGRQGFEP